MLKPTFALEILLDRPHPALWDSHTKREVMRFLRKRGKDIPAKDLSRLLKAILLGPRRDKYLEMTDDDWAKHSDYAIWLRLTKLKQSGVQLPKYAQAWLERSETENSWELRGDHSEEFSSFTASGWHYKDEKLGGFIDFSAMSVEEFSEWSKKQTERWDCSDGWALFCDTNSAIALRNLKGLAERDEWPTAPWYDALSRYSKNNLTKKHHKETASLLVGMPDQFLAKLNLMAARWLESVCPALTKKLLWQLWEKIWIASHIEPGEGDIDFDMTLNHAGGILASVLMNVLGELYPTIRPGEMPGLPRNLRRYFKMISEGESPSAILARTRLAANLLYVFKLDPAWTTEALLRRMDLEDLDFEPPLWEGYLWSPRIDSDLLVLLKPLFFKILDDLEKISERVQENAVQLFTIIAVPPGRGVSLVEAKTMLYNLPTNHLAQVAQTLMDMLRDAGQKAPALWQGIIGPWLKNAWPTHPNAKSEPVSEKLAGMAMETGDAFPHAVATVEKFLVPEERASTLDHLETTDLHSRFPKDALTLIERLVDDKTKLFGDTLPNLLTSIAEANNELSNSERYKRLLARAQ